MKRKNKKMKKLFYKWLSKYGDDVPKPLQKGKYIFIFFMALPALLGLCIWYFGVNFNSILMAFQDPNTGALSFINFERLIGDLTSKSSEIIPAMLNTFKYFFLQAFILPVVVYFISYYLFKKILFNKFFTVMLYIPSIISSVVVITLFKNMISPAGPISYLLFKNGHGVLKDYLTDSKTATSVILFYTFLFSLNGNLLIWIGTFKRIPDSIFDAGKLDGVSEMQELFLIVTPMVSSTISTLFILGLTGIFTATGPILFFTNGAYNTFTINFWLFVQVKDMSTYNYPSAVGLFFTIIGLPIVLLVWKLTQKFSQEIEY